MSAPENPRPLRYNTEIGRIEWQRSDGHWIAYIPTGGGSTPSGPAGGQLSGTYPDPSVVGITEAGGPDALAIDTISDGGILRRSGAAIFGYTISELLDLISSVRGSILYRGAAGWAALAPGTSTHVLTSNGAGADPSYQAPAGGGGGLTHAQAMSRIALRF